MTIQLRHLILIAGAGLIIAAAPATCFAGGFALLEQSVEGSGVAFAGATAGYSDGSAIFFNPAAMHRHDYSLISVSASILDPHADFKNQGSHLSQPLGNMPISGDNGKDGGVTVAVPTFYLVHPTEVGLTLGLGLNAPFGLETEYSDTWVGRYAALKSELMTVTLSPAASYAITEDFSAGAAVNVIYARAEITNAVDFGTIGTAVLGPQAASQIGLLPQQADGYSKITGDDFGVGATAGLSYSYAPGSRAGVAYRAPIRLTLRGDADFDVPPNAQPLTAGDSFVNTDTKSDVTLPDSISAGIIHKFSDKFALLSDIQWTHWAWFDELRVDYSSQQPDTVVEQSWDNTWRASLGAQFWPEKRLRLSAGFTYDEDPISDKYHRTPRLPGNDRYWMAFGAGYYFMDWLWLDLAYTHVFVPDAKSEVAGQTGDVLKGNWELSSDLIGAQLTAAF